ncbi:hypothetical protein Q5P01_011617 [Channa striata]|uniref:Zona pellucida sperm-binding protein 3 n=1 Tax=Channa striata TaxID=64152 RepID=A0AA88MWN3_CHASR|nr:hypothetical protein Q5P01_011617 [Channa striata]
MSVFSGLPGIAYLTLLVLFPPWTSAEDVSLWTVDGFYQTNPVSGRGPPVLPPPYLHLPVSVESRRPLLRKEHFSPAQRTGHAPLPEPVREVLLPVRRTSSRPSSVSGFPVRTWCKHNRMHVQVQRSVLDSGGSVKLGTCGASRTTWDHVLFEYDLSACGTKRTVVDNQVTYSNTLLYEPWGLRGPIRRSAPFTLPVTCYYNRYQYSYKIGYTPEKRMRKVFKLMRNRAKFILTPRNAQWQRLSPSDEYVLGEPMYFEAEAPSMSQDERLYVHSCYATPEKSHTSTPQFPVVTNFGCMIESKEGRSRFIPHKNNVVRFSVDAFLFKGMTGQQLYMHCTMSVGSSIPSPTAKSCNYDTNARRWVELYGSDTLCTCCDSSCGSAASAESKIISSKPWTVEPVVKPTATVKRKTVPTTAITQSPPPQPKTTREVNEWKMTPKPEAIAVTQMGKVKEMAWPFRSGGGGGGGGGGLTWVDGEGGKRWVKGSAVVEQEVVTEPHRVFEEIFGLDK